MVDNKGNLNDYMLHCVALWSPASCFLLRGIVIVSAASRRPREDEALRLEQEPEAYHNRSSSALDRIECMSSSENKHVNQSGHLPK